MTEFYCKRLSKREQMLYRRLIEAVRHGDYTVKAGPFMDSAAVARTAFALNYDHPELFYADFRHLNCLETPMGLIQQVHYTVKAELRKKAEEEVEAGIDAVLRALQKENLKGDYEKCRWIHNYLVRNIR